MSNVKITKQMLDQLAYDTKEMSVTGSAATATMAAGDKLASPSVMCVFGNSDLHAAAYHLSKSLNMPHAPQAVATLLVQESVRDDFLRKLKPLLKPLSKELAAHAGYAHAKDIVQRMKAKTMGATEENPQLVFDLTHEQLGTAVSGLVTVHTFRTAKEAIALCGKETVAFGNASIWNENHSCAYELVVALNCPNYFLNCHLVPLDSLLQHVESGKTGALFENSHLFESLVLNGRRKLVVFPVGTIFAN